MSLRRALRKHDVHDWTAAECAGISLPPSRSLRPLDRVAFSFTIRCGIELCPSRVPRGSALLCLGTATGILPGLYIDSLDPPIGSVFFRVVHLLGLCVLREHTVVVWGPPGPTWPPAWVPPCAPHWAPRASLGPPREWSCRREQRGPYHHDGLREQQEPRATHSSAKREHKWRLGQGISCISRARVYSVRNILCNGAVSKRVLQVQGQTASPTL